MNTLELLRNIDLFRDLDPAALAELGKNALTRRLSIREVLFHEGDEGMFFYVLCSGSLRVFKTAADGKESTIKILSPGEFFAEIVLFGKKRYPATAAAVAESTVVAIHRDSFQAVLERKEWRDSFISSLFGKMSYLTDTIHHLSSYDVEDRFFMFLLKTYGKKEVYEIPLQKKDIASAVGTIPETFSRMIQRLTSSGDLRWDRSTLRLRNGFWISRRDDFGE